MSMEVVAGSPVLTLGLAVLNVLQTLWLAEIAARSRRVRADDAE
jgi:hypothetical protein